MDKELKETQKKGEALSKSCCKGGCTAKKVMFFLCAVALVGGIVWLALACPSCH